MRKQTVYLVAFVALCLVGCVPQRQYADAIAVRDGCITERTMLEAQLKAKAEQIEELNELISVQEDSMKRLGKDYSSIQKLYDQAENANREMREVEAVLNNRINQLLALASAETQGLNEDIVRKEKELAEKELMLITKQGELEKERRGIDSLRNGIAVKEKRIQELEGAMNNLNNKLTEVMTSVEKALAGFSSSDLTIERKNGRIYIQMSEKLLFASGSTTIDAKGKQALKQLADALKMQIDIQILVEGHTDNVPLKSAAFPKDNWDLSVLRATTIVKLLTQDYGLDSKMVEAGGRGEFMPVGSNSDANGRALNRRTEIVIIPNIDAINAILKTLNP